MRCAPMATPPHSGKVIANNNRETTTMRRRCCWSMHFNSVERFSPLALISMTKTLEPSNCTSFGYLILIKSLLKISTTIEVSQTGRWVVREKNVAF